MFLPDLFLGPNLWSLTFCSRRRIPFYVKPRTNEGTRQAEGEEAGEGEGEEEENAGNPPQRANAARDFHKPFAETTHSDLHIYIYIYIK